MAVKTDEVGSEVAMLHEEEQIIIGPKTYLPTIGNMQLLVGSKLTANVPSLVVPGIVKGKACSRLSTKICAVVK